MISQSPIPEGQPDPIESAKSAGLRYVTDEHPGIVRRRAGKGFVYKDADGNMVREEKILSRIKSIVIPPAWQEVWISPYANGHIQATGLDQRGRKQYRYHQRWREVRDEHKYERMVAFGRALPKIRRRTARNLKQRGLPRTKVLAAIVQLLEKTMIRVGNEQYALENKSFGLTTMRNRHAKVRGAMVHFDFKGKGGIRHEIDLADPKLARVIHNLQDLPGQELFQYRDEEGELVSATSGDVNEYLQEITGQEFTAKDFRTWSGTVLASLALQEFEKFNSETQAKKNVVQAIEDVATRLGNTPTICRKCYVHPAILESYLDGSMLEVLQQRAEGELARNLRGLRPEESAVLAFLQKRLKTESRKARRKTKLGGAAMPQGDKSKYTEKQKRKAEHIEESYEEQGVSEKEAEKRAWATVNKMDGGGNKSGSGRGKATNKEPAKKVEKKVAKPQLRAARRAISVC